MLALGNCATEIFIVCRAFGGSNERNIRAALDLGEKGLNFIVTSVRNRGIMMGRWNGDVAKNEMVVVNGLGYLDKVLLNAELSDGNYCCTH